ncbi:MAG: lipopolysaccharide biosynthesis protein [Armatimonadota bacterium]
MSLKQRTVKGLFWTTLILFSSRGLGFLSNIILCRILFPEDFGIVALSMMVINLLYLLQEFGMGAALIYEKGDIKKASNASFYLNLIFSIFLCIILYSFSGVIGDFFKTPQLVKVLKIMVIPLFISSLSVTPQAIINKKMEFKKTFYPEVVANSVYIIIAVLLALRGFGYMAVIYAYIAQMCISTVLYYIVSGWLPSLEFDLTQAKKMLKYGVHLFGSGIIVFVSTNIDNAMIGRLIDSAALGYYYLAYNIANITATTLTPVISKVSFSLFCNLNKDIEGLKKGVLKVLEFTLLVIMPITVGLFVFSTHFVFVVLGAKWGPVVVIIQILCWLALLRAIGTCSGLIFNSIGKTHVPFINGVVFMFLGAGLIYYFTKNFGFIGTAQAVIIQGVLGIMFIFYLGVKNLDFKDYELLSAFKAPVIGSLVLGITGYILKKTVFASLTWYNLIALILIGTALYCFTVWKVKKEILDDLNLMVKELFSKKRHDNG